MIEPMYLRDKKRDDVNSLVTSDIGKKTLIFLV